MQIQLRALALAVVVPMLFATAAAAQSELRTPDGQPDLQGVWDFRTMTPLQRPEDQEREFLTEGRGGRGRSGRHPPRRAALLEPSEVRTEPLPAGGTGAERGQRVGGYNDFWLDYGHQHHRGSPHRAHRRSSRWPTAGADARRVNVCVRWVPSPRICPSSVRSGSGLPARARDDPEDRGLAERCLLGFNSGPPMMPSGYNNNMQLFQTPDHVVILNEMVHDARIIPLDGRPHLPEGVRQWMGDSRGHWDGNTLVVVTQNLSEETGSLRSIRHPVDRHGD